ncbi:cytochrome P450 [Cryptosporangium aurantiacum]|uniref:Cytochrome P450 n=1 Tax=Cryptosporangium aurantiacum TaxID=134849 RepID=A0A1M7RMG7_9ACTN|nr:cytochrome P450 [Cryptosporangium aurantiacum]SHN47292.1 Cytochrome P450 [Cryptosporangium aurantiacum]
MDVSGDDRKSAALAAERVRPAPGARVISGFTPAREVLRSTGMRQAGAGAKDAPAVDPEFASVFFLDGEAHRQKRTAIARFFTPKAIATRYRAVMERTTDELLTGLRAAGGGRLDTISFELAVTVAADIVGLTDSNQKAMARRIQGTLFATRYHHRALPIRALVQLVTAVNGLRFYRRDVLPAIRTRRAQRREDVISHLIDENYPNKAILIECMTYAVAGMVTTREFIVMAAWHLFEKDELRARFLAADEQGQLAILIEILRLEPVAAMLHRRATADAALPSGSAHEGELLALSIRDANVDAAAVGACPFTLDADRAGAVNHTSAYLSFGDGSHRCPGAQVALNETRVFLDRLFRVPGLRLVQTPRMSWSDALMSYELRGAVVTCDRTTANG